MTLCLSGEYVRFEMFSPKGIFRIQVVGQTILKANREELTILRVCHIREFVPYYKRIYLYGDSLAFSRSLKRMKNSLSIHFPHR